MATVGRVRVAMLKMKQRKNNERCNFYKICFWFLQFLFSNDHKKFNQIANEQLHRETPKNSLV